MNYFWPLNINNFTNIDRQNIADFLSDPNNRWTQDKQVRLFEQKFASFVQSKYAIFVSSGSTANTILAQYLRDIVGPVRNKIILPSTTWQTSCSPWIREGFEPVFIDISLDDFCMDTTKLEQYVSKHSIEIACIFPTSLIGFSPNMNRFMEISQKFNVKIMFDNCENTLGEYNEKNVSSFFTSTTSTYFGHQIQSVEGGFIFTNSQKEYEYFLMLRNHGMTRSLTNYGLNNNDYINDTVDSLFDFYCLGNNYRNTDINAFIGQIDLEKANYYKNRRKSLYSIYKNNLNRTKYYLPEIREFCEDVPFCLPVICANKETKIKCIDVCKKYNIEYRPIISGFLGYQTCYKNFFKNNTNIIQNYYNSILLHNNGFYIGLHADVQEENILLFLKEINNIE